MKSGFWRWLFTSSHPIAQRLRWGGVGLCLGVSVFWVIVLGASFADFGTGSRCWYSHGITGFNAPWLSIGEPASGVVPTSR